MYSFNQPDAGRNETTQQKHTMNTKLMVITPDMAKSFLEHKRQNRPVNKSKVSEMASDMKRGLWRLTHQGIAFNEMGQLCDGQNRCEAIVRSGMAVQMMVTFGVPDESFLAIDTNMQPKSNGAILKLGYGVKNANAIAGTARAVQSLCFGDGFMSQQPSDCLAVIDAAGDIINQVTEIGCAGKEYRPTAPVRACFVLFASFDKLDALKSLEGFSNATDAPCSSTRALRHRLTSLTSRNGYANILAVTAYTASAIMRRGENFVAQSKLYANEGYIGKLRHEARDFVEKIKSAVS